jgi:hypothetical protein
MGKVKAENGAVQKRRVLHIFPAASTRHECFTEYTLPALLVDPDRYNSGIGESAVDHVATMSLKPESCSATPKRP